jgi:S-adenosyl methyltransferase
VLDPQLGSARHCVPTGRRGDPEAILAAAAPTLDVTRPVGVLLIGVLHFIPDSDDPGQIVGIALKFRDAPSPAQRGTAAFLELLPAAARTRGVASHFGRPGGVPG